MDKLLTIIVPVYKVKEEFLRKCIESLLNQGRDDYYIILVDDGSPDNCGEICDEYAEKYEIISAIHQKNQGVSVARNSGIKATKTKWIAFVDSDDWVEKDYIDSIYLELNENASDADIVMYEYSREFKNKSLEEFLMQESGYLNDKMLSTIRTATFYKLLIDGKFNPYTVIAIWDKVYKTSFLKENDLWFIPEARKGQDRLFNADALNSTSKIYYINRQLYRYRCWEESRTNRYDENISKLTEIEIKKLKSVIKKHNLQETAHKFLNCRICTRLYSCMRLYCFHENNTKSLKEKIVDVKKLITSEPYKEALATVDYKLLSIQEKIFVFCVKSRLYLLSYILVRLRSNNTQKINVKSTTALNKK